MVVGPALVAPKLARASFEVAAAVVRLSNVSPVAAASAVVAGPALVAQQLVGASVEVGPSVALVCGGRCTVVGSGGLAVENYLAVVDGAPSCSTMGMWGHVGPPPASAVELRLDPVEVGTS